MTLFAVIFTDKLNHADVRSANLAAHIDWLEKNKAIVPVGGSLRHSPEALPVGGLWLAHAESKDQLDQLIQTDPFFIAGLREKYDILYWSKANAERMELI